MQTLPQTTWLSNFLLFSWLLLLLLLCRRHLVELNQRRLRQDRLVNPYRPLVPRPPPSLQALLYDPAQTPNLTRETFNLPAQSRELVCRPRPRGGRWMGAIGVRVSGLCTLELEHERFVGFELGGEACEVGSEGCDQVFQCYYVRPCIAHDREAELYTRG
jgi:hypothetical protein